MSTKDEKEIFEFLDSLPTDDTTNTGSTSSTNDELKEKSGKSDAEILDFLDELEESNKKSTSETKNEIENSKKIGKNELKKEKFEEIEQQQEQQEQQEEIKSNSEPVNDPITSIASWWSNTGSNKVSTQLSSLWGTAQSISEQAEDAIKKAREQSIESNIRNAFKEFGISGIHENLNEMLTDEQRAELAKLPLPDAKKAMESLNFGLNMGLSFVGGTLNEVIDKINALNNKDELIEIIVVHDMKNYLGLSNTIKLTFEDVMNQQVDGIIDVNVIESGTARFEINTDNNLNIERIDFALFNGKGSDAEKLILANIENEMKQRKEKITNERDNEAKTKRTTIYISLLAWTSNKDNVINTLNEKEIIIDSHSTSSFTISCILKDEDHDITINTQSQPLPLKWAHWIEGKMNDDNKINDEDGDDVDPSEWVIEWVNNAISNVIGVTSQSYVIKRMGY
jgi:hypothetical protein